MQKQIIRREYSNEIAVSLNVQNPLLSRIYAARSVQSTQELDRSFNHLLSYESLKDIDKAVKLLADAIVAQQKILIVGDFDADGATSTALAMRALRAFGVEKINYLVPNRFAFGYGLTPELVDVAVSTYQPDVIVTVDNGIANHAGILAAKNKGVCVIVTDHHLAAATLPHADAIVNPNQPNDAFKSKYIAGVGVIFYVMLALRKQLQQINWFAEKNIPQPNMAQFLDLVALGTVADLVPLDHNNRILVHHGLKRIRAGLCIPAIFALLELSDRSFARAKASDLGFSVASRLNAAGRLDDMSLGIECLLCDDPAITREMARRLDQLNKERRSIEKDMQTHAFDILAKLSVDMKNNLPKGLCLFDESWHQGVIGILAARIKDKFNRPTIVFAKGLADEIKGSARSIHGVHIRDTLAYIDANHPGLIMKFGGHAMAAGLTIAKTQFQTFTQIFTEVVAKQLGDDDLPHQLLTDGELTKEEMTLTQAMVLRDAGPFGQAFPEPLFDNVFTIIEQRLIGDKHLKLRLAQDEKMLDAIAFFVDTTLWPNHRCQQIRAVYRLDVNEYKNREEVQLVIEYFEAIK